MKVLSTLTKCLFGFAAISTMLISTAADDDDVCGVGRVRKEIRDLTDSEWSDLSYAIQMIQKDGVFDEFAKTHDKLFPLVHSNPMFFWFHRRFLLDFESRLQKYKPNVMLPYWDEARDAQNPAGSAVLTDKYLGGNGAGSDMCVSNGIQKGMTFNYPKTACLKRQYSSGMNSWYAPEFIAAMIATPDTLANFSTNLQGTVHARPHMDIGGDMIYNFAPLDFIFMVHHANMDRLWALWQAQSPQNAQTYDGKDSKGNQLTPDTLITSYKETLSSVMYLNHGIACYSYSDVGAPPNVDDYLDDDDDDDDKQQSQANSTSPSGGNTTTPDADPVSASKSSPQGTPTNDNNGKQPASWFMAPDGTLANIKRFVSKILKRSQPDAPGSSGQQQPLNDLVAKIANSTLLANSTAQVTNSTAKPKCKAKGLVSNLAKSISPMKTHPIRHLPQELKEKYFGGKLSVKWMRKVFSPLPGYKPIESDDDLQKYASIAVPCPIDPARAKYMKMDYSHLKAAHEKYIEFVKDLTDAGYVSPYFTANPDGKNGTCNLAALLYSVS
ncbi:hypothetical protein H4219_004288 [Mycoemilia scoparia]|uniref:Tyrosinase copper-binding domain-containing protein n=1 Tax=Mycoemilia scoparia TaxID=417184 RepID=A0A9W8DN30_9FUNG|nr:hypothetical protein H4219_004288 [Mycoemilia scoparia]